LFMCGSSWLWCLALQHDSKVNSFNVEIWWNNIYN
jgi:hypothetical protein